MKKKKVLKILKDSKHTPICYSFIEIREWEGKSSENKSTSNKFYQTKKYLNTWFYKHILKI